MTGEAAAPIAPDADWPAAVRDHWFGLDPALWWQAGPHDAAIRARFADLWGQVRFQQPHDFLRSAERALAAVILFDQFPRNMFRGTPQAFATDPLARAVADGAIARGYDRIGPVDRRMFLYMPFEHSESRADQDRSLALFRGLGHADYLRYAEAHHAIIVRFGRFPSRNAVLGRSSTPEEAAAGNPEPA